ncbi:MAG: aspartate aminotransferase family protein [Deltaproteobacteria bacterium]|nr:aspartate aminotransferase family protein [Candidatus Zymogenaceae bacterium]
MTTKGSLQQHLLSQSADRALFERAADYALDYMESAYGRAVTPTADSLAALSIFDEPLSDDPCDPREIVGLLHFHGSPATLATTGGRYFGFVNGAAVPAAVAAGWIADAWDQNAGLYVMSPIAARLEAVCERWLVELFGLPEGTVMGLVSGTSTATLCGLAAGRNALLARAGWDVNKQGLFDAPKIRVVLGEQAHATVFKALALLGMGNERVQRVGVDAQGRMIASKMPQLDDKTLVITQAGNVNSGAFDPIDEICSKARAAGAWVHVDGAFGLWAAASEKKRHLTRGVQKADSWSVDAHKTLNAPYDCGIVLCADRQVLVAAMQATGSYIQYGEHGKRRDGMLTTLDMSRRARAVELWATLKALGKRGVEELVDGLCDRAAQFAEGLVVNGFTILNDVVFNQVLVACDTPEETKATLEQIQQSGECWCGGTVWDGKPAIRISVCSWATTEADVDRSVAAFTAVRGRK